MDASRPNLRRRLATLSALLIVGSLIAACNDDGGLGGTASGAAQVVGSFSFPQTPPSTEGPGIDRVVEIRNTGAATLKLANLEQNYAQADEFKLFYFKNGNTQDQFAVADLDRVVELAPNESLGLVLNYKPLTDAGAGGDIRFETTDPDQRTLVIPITGDAAGAQIIVNPTTVDFGRVPAATEAFQDITVTNVGQATLFIEDLRLSGSEDFTVFVSGEEFGANPEVITDPDGDGAPGLSVDKSFIIRVRYFTEADGGDAGQLTIVSNDAERANLFIDLIANGASPCIKVFPETLDFSASLVNQDTIIEIRLESCGGQLLTVSNVFLDDGTSDAYTLGDIPDEINLPAMDDPTNPPTDGFDVIFRPTEELAYGGRVIIESNDPLKPSVEVPIVGRGTINECPVPRVVQDQFAVRPLDIIVLDGSPSTDADSPNGRPTKYTWSVVQAPNGSTQEPKERFNNPARPQDGGRRDDTATATAVFFVDVIGEYVLELSVTDALDTTTPSAQCPGPIARIQITAQPNEDIHVELVWDTPGDADQTDASGSDVDLHLLHPTGRRWSAAPLDCYYANGNPDWGQAGPAGNPNLDIDDTNGAGPENITVTDPENTANLGGQYRVGVHYFRAENFGIGTFGASLATVRIRLSGELSLELEQNLLQTNHFWEVASIIWTDAERRAVVIDRYYERVP